MSISFQTRSEEYAYEKDDIIEVIKTIKTYELSDVEDLSYTANSDLIVKSNLLILCFLVSIFF
jgi:hypothetical protein